jgi:hypothetical protein
VTCERLTQCFKPSTSLTSWSGEAPPPVNRRSSSSGVSAASILPPPTSSIIAFVSFLATARDYRRRMATRGTHQGRARRGHGPLGGGRPRGSKALGSLQPRTPDDAPRPVEARTRQPRPLDEYLPDWLGSVPTSKRGRRARTPGPWHRAKSPRSRCEGSGYRPRSVPRMRRRIDGDGD